MTDDAVIAELAVHRLLHRYVAAVDALDPEQVGACFAPGGVLVVRGVERTDEQIVAFYRERLTFPTLHLITGITIASRDDGLVEAGCNLFAIEMRESGWHGVSGRYDDVIRVEDARAVFVRRHIGIHQRVTLTPAT